MPTPWSDLARIAIYVLLVAIAGLMLRICLAHGMWHRPWAGDNAGYAAYAILAGVQAYGRLRALNSPPPEWWPTALTVVSLALAVVWLLRRVYITWSYFPDWLFRNGPPARRDPRDAGSNVHSLPRHGRGAERNPR